jgi:hypothetical protein
MKKKVKHRKVLGVGYPFFVFSKDGYCHIKLYDSADRTTRKPKELSFNGLWDRSKIKLVAEY